MTTNDELMNTAIKYVAQFKWKVFPLHSIKNGKCSCKNNQCTNQAKHPRTQHGVKEASSDPETVKKWWTTWPDANIGIATGEASGFFGLDVDPDKGGDESLKKLEDENGKLPNTVESLTGGGGRHLLFEYPAFKIKNAVNLLPGLDVRGDGGYIVAPPSLHISGKQYTWEISSLPDEILIAKAPVWLLSLITIPTLTSFHNVNLTTEEILQGLPLGQRDNAIFDLICRLKRAGVPKDIALKNAEETAQKCNPPFDINCVKEKIDRLYKDSPITLISHNSLISLYPSSSKYPKPLESAAYYGLAGDIVCAIEPHSEADPAALLIQFLVAFGNIIGRRAHFVAEGDRHYLNLFAVLVGETSKGRKGSSWSQIRRVFESIDLAWVTNQISSGLSSGEGLIWNVRDPIEKTEPIKEKKKISGYQSVQTDPGVKDKRLIVLEPEFASTLRVLGRDGNTLSALIRQAWDTGNLRTLTKNSPAKSTGAHISTIGHITNDELRRYLNRTEIGNGFGNRFLWFCVRRSKLLPEGGKIQEVNFSPLLAKLKTAVNFASQTDELKRDEQARKLWIERYEELSKGQPGLLGALTGRAEAQVMRLASLYALLDCSTAIRVEHLQAAFSIWDYVLDSVAYVFGDKLGDPISDEILIALRDKPFDGMTSTQISSLFGNHQTGKIQRSLSALLEAGLIESTILETGGRNAQLWKAIIAKKAN